ncbi:unnamed protein product, partial [Symbiodinium pilosum]
SSRMECTNGVTSTDRISGKAHHYLFVSADVPNEDDCTAALPSMSLEGGSEEEFQAYWDWNSRTSRILKDGWIERMAHPQVNCETYWYNHCTDEITWEPPAGRPGVRKTFVSKGKKEDKTWCWGHSDFSQEGPVWTFTPPELKSIMKEGHAGDFGLATEELARRACYEFETWLPRVLSWHDYQYRCFWFYGGKDSADKNKDSGASAKSFFSADAEASRQLFADEDFFEACTRLLCKRLDRMHPINLTYFVWTYVRAGVVHKELLHAVAEHLCKGWLPTLDRCSLGTMLWNFSKLEFRHDRFFELSAQVCIHAHISRLGAGHFLQDCTGGIIWNLRAWHARCHGCLKLTFLLLLVSLATRIFFVCACTGT